LVSYSLPMVLPLFSSSFSISCSLPRLVLVLPLLFNLVFLLLHYQTLAAAATTTTAFPILFLFLLSSLCPYYS
jgi:hypothetical protein